MTLVDGRATRLGRTAEDICKQGVSGTHKSAKQHEKGAENGRPCDGPTGAVGLIGVNIFHEETAVSAAAG